MSGADDFVDPITRARGLESVDDVRRLYADWAERYDEDVFEQQGFIGSRLVAELLHECLPDGDAVVADLGCGTGSVGRHLAELGHRRIVGYDISPEMLAVAERFDVYEHLAVADLTAAAPPLHGVAAAVSAGTFTSGHVGAAAVPGLLAAMPPNSLVVWAVAPELWPIVRAEFERNGADVLQDDVRSIRRAAHDPSHLVVGRVAASS